MKPVEFLVTCVLLLVTIALPVRVGFANSPDDFGPTPEQQLGRLGIDTSTDSLISIVTDSTIDPEIRYLASVSLGRTKDPAHLPELEKLLSEENVDVRLGALIALRTIASSSSVDSLVRTLDEDDDSTVRRVAVTALEAVGSDNAMNAILLAAEDQIKPAEVRAESIFALQRQINLDRLHYPDVRHRLKPMLDDEDASVRLAAALSMSAGGDQDAIPVLVDIATRATVADWSTAKAMHSIQELTKEDFGFFGVGVQRASRLEKQKAISDLNTWWAKNRGKYERPGSGQD